MSRPCCICWGLLNEGILHFLAVWHMIADAGMWLPWGSHYAGIQGNSSGWMCKVFLALFHVHILRHFFLTEMSFLSFAKVAIPFILHAIRIKKMTETLPKMLRQSPTARGLALRRLPGCMAGRFLNRQTVSCEICKFLYL